MAASTTTPSSSSLPSPSIILVDDEMNIVTVFCKVLQRDGYEVKGFSNPVQALDFFAAHTEKVAVFVTDLRVPFMSGIELTEGQKTQLTCQNCTNDSI
jgi:adenylate cyclase